ncbi:MAG: outer membrane protein assembly factor BamD [Geobacteraceae bacterium]|nr:outer membrane protein assembly factor BamD [Geobacteraceae bacterium]
MLLGAGFVVASEIDDSSLFVEAFTAYQKKDYLLAIEKIQSIDQLFPDTPLHDVALLLLARSGLNSGDNELAAKTILQFTKEFPASPLTSSIEEELLRLGSLWQKGERPLPAIPLRTAARKIRDEQAAQERSTAEKRQLTAKTEQGRISQQTLESGPDKHERTAAEKPALDSVRAAINLPGGTQIVAVGQPGEIPFEVVNLGTSEEVFILETTSHPEYEPTLKISGRTVSPSSHVTIGTSAPLTGSIMFRMPPDRVDGHKSTLSLRVVSAKYHHLVQARDAQIIAAAPLVRVVAKPDKQAVEPGEYMRYRITVLNAGTLPALAMTVRVVLPAQVDFLGASAAVNFVKDQARLDFRVERLDFGTLSEFMLDVKVREDSRLGEELRSKVEIVNDQLKTKETFTSSVAVVQQKPALSQPAQKP